MSHLNIVDRPYHVVSERRNQTQAREYCSEKGSLWSPKNLSDCENFSHFLKKNSEKKDRKKRYWISLCKNEADRHEDKLCNTGVLGQLYNCNNSSDECVSVKIRGTSLTHHLQECNDKKYFVCQVNKGNKIFS